MQPSRFNQRWKETPEAGFKEENVTGEQITVLEFKYCQKNIKNWVMSALEEKNTKIKNVPAAYSRQQGLTTRARRMIALSLMSSRILGIINVV